MNLKDALVPLYTASRELQAQRVEAEDVIQKLQDQDEDNTILIDRIQKIVDRCYEAEQKINDDIYTVKKAIKILEKGVDDTWIVW